METAFSFPRNKGLGDARRVGDAHRAVGELLLEFGITPHLCGFDPICAGIRIRAERDRIRGVPAERALSHETAIRGAIGTGFLHTDEIHAQIFPFSDRPSNSEFICTLAELVQVRLHAKQ